MVEIRKAQCIAISQLFMQFDDYSARLPALFLIGVQLHHRRVGENLFNFHLITAPDDAQ